jgi:hypothetical protein
VVDIPTTAFRPWLLTRRLFEAFCKSDPAPMSPPLSSEAGILPRGNYTAYSNRRFIKGAHVPTPKIHASATTTLQRIYPKTPLGAPKPLALDAARGETVSFQVAWRNESTEPLTVKLGLKAPDDIGTRVRRVGYVPMPHLNTGTPLAEIDNPDGLPGLVPDPLFDEDVLRAGPLETNAFWCNLALPRDCRPGRRTVVAELSIDSQRVARLPVSVTVHNAVLQPRQDFPVVQWFYADSLCDFYKVEPFEERFWPVVEPYMKDLVAHGQDTIYTPVFTPPLDGVKRPTQLLKVRKRPGGRYSFDWTDVKRWIDTAQRAGIKNFEWTHFFTQWGVKHALRIYEKKHGEDALLWPPETGATSSVYRKFLSQFLPELKNFIDREKLSDCSFFHVSDEPHGEHVPNYRAARELLRELAPWMKTMDALSDIEFGRQHLTDLPIPSIRTTLNFIAEKITCGTYYCCGPRGAFLNRLMDTPLPKIRMNGWLFWRFQPRLFLHWGYNYWYKSQTRQMIDPFTVSDGQAWPGWAHGDTFCVYPGPNGPIDSIRWEVFGESLQDYALLQTLGIDPRARLLRPLKSFSDFPKSADWIARARREILSGG